MNQRDATDDVIEIIDNDQPMQSAALEGAELAGGLPARIEDAAREAACGARIEEMVWRMMPFRRHADEFAACLVNRLLDGVDWRRVGAYYLAKNDEITRKLAARRERARADGGQVAIWKEDM
jgi:hypothetical protein